MLKDGAYVINLDEYSDSGTHSIVLYAWNNSVSSFDSFGLEHIPKEIIKFIEKSTIMENIFWNRSTWFSYVHIFLYWIY